MNEAIKAALAEALTSAEEAETAAADDLEISGIHRGQPGAHLGFFTVPGLRARHEAELDAAAEAGRQEERLRQPWTFIQP